MNPGSIPGVASNLDPVNLPEPNPKSGPTPHLWPAPAYDGEPLYPGSLTFRARKSWLVASAVGSTPSPKIMCFSTFCVPVTGN